MSATTPALHDTLTTLDWSQPWFAPWQASGEAAAANILQGASVHAALNQTGAACAPIGFVPQTALPPGEAYERFIFTTRSVPTRDNLHDFFNGLCWLQFPLTKQRLNALQAAEIATAGVGDVRGPVRDALTLFDENAALLIAPDALWDALIARDWRRLLVDMRPLWADAQLLLFGHALLEKLVDPYKSITAHVYRVRAPPGDLPALDAWVAESLSPALLASKPFTPLPVLGVPGWWAENQNFCFYDDSQVFRARRT